MQIEWFIFGFLHYRSVLQTLFFILPPLPPTLGVSPVPPGGVTEIGGQILWETNCGNLSVFKPNGLADFSPGLA